MPKIDKAELARRAEMVVAEHGGIVAFHEAFYIHSIAYSAGRSSEAFTRFEVAHSLKDTADAQVSAIHEALGHAAALSRFFWPSPTGSKRSALTRLRERRATTLREAFGLDEGSSLRKRGLRNAMEHFDERLDEYLLENGEGFFLPDPIVAEVELSERPAGHIFKMVDPANLGFVLLGEVHLFGDIRREVERVYEQSVEMRDNGGRLRRRPGPAGSQ